MLSGIDANGRTVKDRTLTDSDRQVQKLNSPRAAPKYARATVKMVINAPPEKVWSSLVDFPHYPQIFKRMRTCAVVKQQGDLVWLESNLKPQFFVRRTYNRAVTDLAGKPMVLNFHTLDEKYDSVRGRWELSPAYDEQHCQVTYTVEMAPGAMVPECMISLVLKFVQKEIVDELKDWVESSTDTRTGSLPRDVNQNT